MRQLLAGGAAVLALVGVVALVVNHLAALAESREDWEAGMERTRGQLLPRTPAAAVHALLSAVARDDPSAACWSFSPAAVDQLTSAFGVEDCAAAVRALHAGVDNPLAYESPDSQSIATVGGSSDGELVVVDACALAWDGLPGILGGSRTRVVPGPQLGVLDMRRVSPSQGLTGYWVVGYRRCSPT